MKYDLFICHASKDKEDIVEPLATELRKCGLRVWYDRFVLKIGDSLRAKIDEGLSSSKYGVVVLSPAFFSKRWPQAELDALFARQTSGHENILLPVWHQMGAKDVGDRSPLLAGFFAAHTDKGVLGVVGSILEVVRPDLGRFACDGSGRYLCDVRGGPFAGVQVLLIDAPEAPQGGPKDILKDDVVPYVLADDGKHYNAGLFRRRKLPHLLTEHDTFSLPVPAPITCNRHGPVLEIVIPYARYKFKRIHEHSDGTLIPLFEFDKVEPIATRV